MDTIFRYLFKPPVVPPIRLPLPSRVVPGVLSIIGKLIELAYKRGVFDGFVAGALLTLLLWSFSRERSRGHRQD